MKKVEKRITIPHKCPPITSTKLVRRQVQVHSVLTRQTTTTIQILNNQQEQRQGQIPRLFLEVQATAAAAQEAHQQQVLHDL